MLDLHGEVDEDLLNADICWMVTDNITGILTEPSKKPNIIKFDMPSRENIIKFLSIVRYELNNNKLLVFGQDLQKDDHWFAVIGDNGNVHIIEHTEEECNFDETMTINDFVYLLERIIIGTLPDRFYKIKSKDHYYQVLIFDRKKLSRQVVVDYIKNI